jgi:hypothetical protein
MILALLISRPQTVETRLGLNEKGKIAIGGIKDGQPLFKPVDL